MLGARKKRVLNALDYYVTTQPSAQNAIDLFKGEWSSAFPVEYKINAGQTPLFEDSRVTWLNDQIKGGLRGKTVLELGPLEGAHTYMLEKCGAKSVLGVESNSHAFLKCLITKEVLNMKRSNFLLGDLNAYMEANPDKKFDVCMASGVLYHQQDPLKTLKLISDTSDIVLLWTHYYDDKIITNKQSFSAPVEAEAYGLKVTYHPKRYMEATTWGGFCGGSNKNANWMTREGILSALKHFGYSDIRITLDHAGHPNGPAFVVLGQKRKSAKAKKPKAKKAKKAKRR